MAFHSIRLSQVLVIFILGLSSNSIWAQTCTDPNISVSSGETCSDVLASSDPSTVTVIGTGVISNSVTRNALNINLGASTDIINSGTITAIGTNGININGIYNTGIITTLINNGTITSSSSGGTLRPRGGPVTSGIYNTGIITTLINSGTITAISASNAYGIVTLGNINTLTNTGAITATSTGGGVAYGIGNGGYTLTTLNNTQGGNDSSAVTTALTYYNYLPTNYNIGIVSATHYGQLSVIAPDNSNSAIHTFGIYGTPSITARTYAGVLTNNVTPLSVQAQYDNMTLALVSNGSVYDLTFTGISLAQTQASLATSANRLRSVFNQSIVSSNFANMNTYDCNLFDTNGMCISAGGRYTTVDNPNANTTSAVVVLGYKATPNIRIGGFLDQNVSNNTPTGIKVSNKNPLMGLFAVWNQNEDYLGYQVKIANAYQDKDVTTTRDAVQTTEAGSGTTNLNSQSYVAELSYAFNANEKTMLRPYLALRHTTIKQDAYTESGITNPLTYAGLTDRSTTALIGLKLNHALSRQTNLTASLGIEQDLDHHTDQYSATSAGISGLTFENFANSIHRTRPVASVGAYYTVSKTQRIAGDIYYQELPFQSTGSTTAYFSYMIGL
jgi:hypothetical protein